MNAITVTDIDSGSTISVAPDRGFNCFRFAARVDGREVEVLAAEPDFPQDGKASHSGIPLLFPFPNRVRATEYVWNLTGYVLPTGTGEGEVAADGNGNAIHGFCVDRPWRAEKSSTNSVTGTFQLSRDAPDRLPLWPTDFILTVRYEVLGPVLRCDVTVENPGDQPLPFGLGTHPYFRLPLGPGGTAAACTVEVPASKHWVAENGVPTGETEQPGEGLDLRDGPEFGSLQLDDYYTDQSAEGGAIVHRIYDGNAGLVVTQKCDPQFRDVVVFTPPWFREGAAGAVCVEPYTCVTDAINLQQRGIDAGLRTLEPGGRWTTWFEIHAGPIVA